MAIYHGVEWHHDTLSLLAATHGEKVALWTGFGYPGVESNNPGEATTVNWAHWHCVQNSARAMEQWLEDGVAIERPNLPIRGMRSGKRCAICSGE